MWWQETGLDWRKSAPRWTVVLVAGLVTAELAHFVRALPPIAAFRIASEPMVTRARAGGSDSQRLASAHLFGAAEFAAAPIDAANAPNTQLPLVLSGVMATGDPNIGYAILGEKGKQARLYWPGVSLESGPGGRLYQIFADRVVLDLNGRLETLRLPHDNPLWGVPTAQSASAESGPGPAAGPPGPVQDPGLVVTAAESAFSSLNVEQNMQLHPGKRYQREYGLRDGDVLTAVNGVEITDSDVLTNVLKASGKSLSLTFTRDGIQKTVNLPLYN